MTHLAQIWELNLFHFSLCNRPLSISARATSYCLSFHLMMHNNIKCINVCCPSFPWRQTIIGTYIYLILQQNMSHFIYEAIIFFQIGGQEGAESYRIFTWKTGGGHKIIKKRLSDNEFIKYFVHWNSLIK